MRFFHPNSPTFKYFLLLHASFLPLVATRCATTPTAKPICIIGGGITGLTLANLLQDRLGPANVHLYEGETRFGGKMATFRTPTKPGSPTPSIKMEKGPVVFSTFMRNTIRYVHKYNLTLTPFRGGPAESGFIDPETGSVTPNMELFEDELIEGTEKYREAYNQATNNGAALKPGYTNLSQAQLQDLSKPIETWLRDRDMPELVQFFAGFLTSLGYGDVKDTPALYALKVVDADAALEYLNDWKLSSTVKEGFDTLAEKMSVPIKNKYLGWRATQITRNSVKGANSQTVVFTLPKGEERVVNCSRTILAFPPLLRNLMGLITNLSVEEKRIFNQVKVIKYSSVGVEIPTLDRTMYTGMVPQLEMDEETGAFTLSAQHPVGDGGLVLLAKAIQDSGNQSYYTAYGWIYGDYSNQADSRDLNFMEGKINATLAKMYPSFKTLFRAESTQYFPHVTSKSIQDGFFNDFAALQGVGGLYYATTLLTFEFTNGAIEIAEDFVEKYF